MKSALITFTRSTAGSRTAIYVCLAVAVATLLTVPNRDATAVVLAVNALFIAPLHATVAHKHMAVVAMLQDLLVTVTISIVAPELWAACVVAAVAISIWSTHRAEIPIQRPLAMIPIGLIVIVGAVNRPTGWMSICLAAVVLSAYFSFLAYQQQGQFRDREDDLAQALSTSGAIVHISDLNDGRIDSLDGPIQEITGWSSDEWMTMDHRTLLHPDDHASFWVDADDVVQGNVIDRKGRFRCADGSYAWLRDVSRIVRTTDGRLKLRGISMDVTEIEHAHALIRHQAETDSLTGLANRSVLTTELERRLTSNHTFALVLLDLDRFKNVNDTLGHGFGDGVLIEIARRLKAIAGDDLVVRLGGDEFAVVVSDMHDDADASQFAKRIAGECSRVMSLQGVTISSGASIGIAMCPRDGDTVQTLLRHADIAMYAAKREGRSFQIFNTGIKQAPLEEVTLSAAIGPALEKGEFVLHFQPKINTLTGEVTGFEGLARWEHPELGVLTPARFLHLIKLSVFTTDFTNHVLDLGARFAAVCAAHGNAVPVSVNISARSLYDDSFPERVESTMKRHGLVSNQLLIEITEHDIMNRTSNNTGMLDRLDALGVALSVDDFGTGYSSLARLIDLPVTEIKIDRRFIAKLLVDKRDAVIVRSIIDLGRNLDLHVVAEGIECQEEAELLSSWGCEHAQGFLYSPAVSPTEAIKLLTVKAPPVSVA